MNNYCGINGGLHNNTINFDGSNTIFLLGQNNVGKSSFLKAYKDFYNNEKPGIDKFYNKEISNKIEIQIEIEFEAGEKIQLGEKLNNAELKYFYGANNNRLTIKKVWSTNDQLSNDFTLKNDKSNFDDIGYAGVGEHNIFKALFPMPIFIAAMPSESDVDSIINEILSEKVKQLLKDTELKEYKDAQETIRKLQQKTYQSNEIEKYKTTVNEYFSKMFSDIKISISERNPDLVLKGIDKKFQIDFEHISPEKQKVASIPTGFENIGHGAIRTALFTLLLMKDVASGKTETIKKKEYLVLFEEPELFLHPKLAKTLRELIYEVSQDATKFQVICASHSPQMIDITKPKTSLVRMVKNDNYSTNMYQINDNDLSDQNPAGELKIKEEVLEALRFNPFICESFYADEVILVEGDTEAVILRGYLQEVHFKKDIFIVNCGSVNNFPFFQKIFSKFSIKYHLIFDTDERPYTKKDDYYIFNSGIQKSISDKYTEDRKRPMKPGLMCIHIPTFEPAHEKLVNVSTQYTYSREANKFGKPYAANLYWKEKLQPALRSGNSLDEVPIINYIKNIINS